MWRLRGGRSAYFFSAQFFFCMPSSFHPFLVYGICLRNSPNIFLVFVCWVPFAPFLPFFASVGAPYACALDARVSTRVVHRKPSARASSFRVHTGRNVWLRMKVEKLFGVSFTNFHSRTFSGLVFFIVGKILGRVLNTKKFGQNIDIFYR